MCLLKSVVLPNGERLCRNVNIYTIARERVCLTILTKDCYSVSAAILFKASSSLILKYKVQHII